MKTYKEYRDEYFENINKWREPVFTDQLIRAEQEFSKWLYRKIEKGSDMRTWVDDWGHTINIMFPKKNLVKMSIKDTEALIDELGYQIKVAKGLAIAWTKERLGVCDGTG